MRVFLLSDIHLEFLKGFNHITDRLLKHKNKVDVCVLAGDIGHHSDKNYGLFLKQTREIFPRVMVVPGNHEYFVNEKMNVVNNKLEEICEENKCDFLNKKTVSVGKFSFIGCTLWSFDPNYPGIWPNVYAKKYVTELDNTLHGDNLAWLKQEIPLHKNPIVITHHCPSHKLVHSAYTNHPRIYKWMNNLDQEIKKPIAAWLCGHSHEPKKIDINGVPIYLNPVGYNKEKVKWTDDLIIDVKSNR